MAVQVSDTVLLSLLPRRSSDVSDGAQLRAARRQVQQADVISQTQGASRLVPASTVKDEDGMGARGHGAADLNQAQAPPSGQETGAGQPSGHEG